jgi:YVTN family beta-propeller protein
MTAFQHRFAVVVASGLLLSSIFAPAQAQKVDDGFDPAEAVGRAGSNRVVLPVNQVITPAGVQVELHGLRPQVLALSPDGKLLLTSGKTRELCAIDPDTATVVDRIKLPDDGVTTSGPAPASTHILKPDKDEQVSYTGLIFNHNGSRVYMSNVKGGVKIFSVEKGHKIKGIGGFALPDAKAPRRKEEIPSGLALSADDGRLYVVASLSNRLLECNPDTGEVLRSFDVGVAPYDVIVHQHLAFVSNWGGRRPAPGSVVGPAGVGTTVRVDARSVASEGSVSIIDLKTGKLLDEILTGRHASAMAISPDGKYLIVANSNEDTLSVIDLRTRRIVETILMSWGGQSLFGAAPNALAMDAKGRTLYVCNGTQNAVAAIAFNPGKSQIRGMIPTGWYPGAIVFDKKRSMIDVANIKGTLPGPSYEPGRDVYNSHQHLGTVSLIPVPRGKELAEDTKVVLRNYRRALIEEVFKPARPNAKPLPVPERLGEPSLINHVVYLVKENRTFDQVLGDIRDGSGEPDLCVFGEKVTPNQHKMVREFVLLDNTYCSSILSADGHQWALGAYATDYMEKSFADFPRSYPDMQELNDLDALAYSPKGFIWDDALAHGKTVRDYGECSVAVTSWKDPSNKRKIHFLDHYTNFVNHGDAIVYSNYAGSTSLQPCIMTNTVGWDMTVPDVFRAERIISDLKEFEKKGELPNLIIICLPSDHTSGTDPDKPIPSAQVADNDLAFGQIVEAFSHSRFWKDTCIFAIEDDPQAGWDHVSGYRTTAYVVSPYTRRHAVVSTCYNQPSLLRTMELMLGLPPMNQMDASAQPMRECFTTKANFTPFECLTNVIPLDAMNPPVSAIHDKHQRTDAVVSRRLPLSKPDQCREDVLNKIIWHAQKGFNEPYPAWAITETGDGDD